MDNFMDKLAQKLNAQEIIRANSQAEAAELKRLQVQLEAYDECLQEMRRLNLKNVELNDKVQKLVEEGIQKITAAQEEAGDEELLKEVKQELDSLSQSFEEFVHKENVKVYRNVQAAVTEELKNQTDLLTNNTRETEKKNAPMKPMMIAVLVFSVINAAMLAVNLLFTMGIL